MSQWTTEIYIKPYLKDFLMGQFGDEPIKFPRGCDIINRIVRLTDKQPIKLQSRKYNIKILLPYNNLKDPRIYNYLSENSQKIIERYVKYLFNEILHEHIMRNKRDMLIHGSIYNFFEIYEINMDNITPDGLKKKYYRFIKKFKKI